MTWSRKVGGRNEPILKRGSVIPGPVPFQKNHLNSHGDDGGEGLACPSYSVLHRIVLREAAQH